MVPTKAGGFRARLGNEMTVAIYGSGELAVSIGSELHHNLGWAPGDRVDILFGTGAHHGWAQIVSRPGGKLRLYRSSKTRSTGSLVAKTSRLPENAGNAVVHAEKVHFEVNNRDCLTFRLPAGVYSSVPLSAVSGAL